MITQIKQQLLDATHLAVASLDGNAQITVGPTTCDYSEHDFSRLRFNVTVAVGCTDDEHAEDLLDLLLELNGLRDALEADRTLGGLVADVFVDRCSGYQIARGRDVHGNDYELLSATWTVSCMV